MHLASATVSVGETVRRGEVIGTVGLFPYSGDVVHVHWMLCAQRSCSGYGSEGGTADPLKLTEGCFEPDEGYPDDKLVLTYPVEC